MSTFSASEARRYARHLVLPGVGSIGQQKLKEAKVLVIGAGGLGSPLISYLAASGIGTIGIVDFDAVDLSNLQRQVLYTMQDLGQQKAVIAAQWVKNLNPSIHVEVHNVTLQYSNALEIIQAYDVVADGTDNFGTRYLVNDACVYTGKPLVYGSIFRFEGQISVFNHKNANGELGPNYRDIFPEPPPPQLIPNCAEGGVFGVLPGLVGCIQATEVIKIVCGLGTTLSGKLLLIEALNQDFRTLNLRKNPQNPLNHGTDRFIFRPEYNDPYCQITNTTVTMVKSINVHQLKQMQIQGEDFQLIDVREPWEYELVNLQGLLIPKAQVEANVEKIERGKKVVMQCRSGARSADVIVSLQNKYGFTNLYNLEGGILAWAREIDSSLPTY